MVLNLKIIFPLKINYFIYFLKTSSLRCDQSSFSISGSITRLIAGPGWFLLPIFKIMVQETPFQRGECPQVSLKDKSPNPPYMFPQKQGMGKVPH